MMKQYIILIFLVILFSQIASAAHFIVGTVNNSLDGTSSNNLIMTLWNPLNVISDNITDIIGSNGNSQASNFYMVDCELLSTPCQIGDTISLKIFDDGNGYHTKIVNLTITGAGFDIAEELLLNSMPKLNYIYVDDDIFSPMKEIDLTAGGNRLVNCIGEIYDLENDNFSLINGVLFDNSASFYSDSDDYNKHYTNSSCFSISNITSNTTFFNCSFSLRYFSNSNNWNCTLTINDSEQISRYHSNNTFVNKLLSFSIPDEINYGYINVSNVSREVNVNISNYGNVKLNLSLQGYANNLGDNLSMNCSLGINNISIYYQKYNLTFTNPGNLNLLQFETLYKNLTSSSIVNKLGLSQRQDDLVNDAINTTYWRIYLPTGVAGSCSGKVIFGATQAQAS